MKKGCLLYRESIAVNLNFATRAELIKAWKLIWYNELSKLIYLKYIITLFGKKFILVLLSFTLFLWLVNFCSTHFIVRQSVDNAKKYKNYNSYMSLNHFFDITLNGLNFYASIHVDDVILVCSISVL